jgi:hypothetical protein
MALTMARGYTKAQAASAWTTLSGETDLTAAGALWDSVQAALDGVDNANLSGSGSLCVQCGQKVVLDSGGRLLHHLGRKGRTAGRFDPCLGVGMKPAEVRT